MMNNTILSNIFMFAAGAAIGTVVTWKLVKTKYEQIANEEIEEIREYYRSKNESSVERGKRADSNPVDEYAGESERIDAVTYLKEKIDKLGYNPAFGGEETSLCRQSLN